MNGEKNRLRKSFNVRGGVRGRVNRRVDRKMESETWTRDEKWGKISGRLFFHSSLRVSSTHFEA